MTEQPLVSIITPCYNQGVFLSEALDSIIAQTYSNWECIIINDGSADNTEDVANEYRLKDSRIRYIYQTNQGVIAAKNNAIHASYGKYIVPLDADDKIAPTFIEKCVGVMESDVAVSIVHTNTELFGERQGMDVIPDFSIARMLIDNCIHNTAMFRRSDYDMTIGYNPNMREGLEDWDFWISILEEGGHVHKIEESLFFYRTQSVSRNMCAMGKSDRLKKQIIRNHSALYLKNIFGIIKQYRRTRPNPILTLFRFVKRRYCR